MSVVLGTAGALLAPRLLALMGASPSVIATGRGYATIMLGGEAAIIVLFVVNAIFRGAGDAAIAMRVLWLANIINIVLGPLLIFGVGPFPRARRHRRGDRDDDRALDRRDSTPWCASSATASRVPVARRHLRARPRRDAQILRLSGSATLQNLIGMASWIGLVRILAGYGSEALAGYTIAIRLIIFALLPSWGLSNAAATMVGQSLGARKPDRAEASVWRAGRYNAVFLTGVGVIFFAGGAARSSGRSPSDPTVTGYAVALPPDRGARLPALRLRHGADPVVQRRGRHLDARRGSTSSASGCSRSRSRGGSRGPAGLGPSGVFWAIMASFSLLAGRARRCSGGGVEDAGGVAGRRAGGQAGRQR